MNHTLVHRAVYAPDGSGLVISGQPAALLVQLTDDAGHPQDLTGRAFVQQLQDDTGAVVADAAGANQASGEILFVLEAAVLTALLAGGGAADLTSVVAELITDGQDVIFTAPFGIRTASAASPQARIAIQEGTLGPIVVRYVGAPGAAGSGAAGPATGITFEDTTEPPIGADTVQAAIAAIVTRANLIATTILALQPTYTVGQAHLATGAVTLQLSEVVSHAGVFRLWRGGVLQAPSGFAVDPAGSADITIPPVGDDGSGGESFEWVHDGVDPLRIAAALTALGL